MPKLALKVCISLTNVKNLLFFLFYTIWDGLSQKTVSRFCPFKTKEKTCVLVESNVGLSGLLEEDYAWTYFEKLDTQVSY
jgi:hypothetical protein